MNDQNPPALQRLIDHMPKQFDLTLVTLKGHLLVEEQLDDYIDRHLRNSAALHGEQVQFKLKVKLAQALSDPVWPESTWTALLTLNKLRNSLAHRLENANLAVLMEEFIRLCTQAGWQPQPGDFADLEGQYMLCIVYTMGMLAPSPDEVAPDRKGLASRR